MIELAATVWLASLIGFGGALLIAAVALAVWLVALPFRAAEWITRKESRPLAGEPMDDEELRAHWRAKYGSKTKGRKE